MSATPRIPARHHSLQSPTRARSFWTSVGLGALRGAAALAEGVVAPFATAPDHRPLAYAAHRKLFRLMLPLDRLGDRITPKLHALAADAERAVWEALKTERGALDALTFITPMLCGATAVHAPDDAFNRLWRRGPSQLFYGLRFLYLSTIYGSAFGEALTQSLVRERTALAASAPETVVHDFRRDTAAQFNRDGKIFFDPQTQSIRHRDGPFDAVIVGSGAGGSVLAHRLSQAGQRVLVLEHGAFFVPGAIDGTQESAAYERLNRRTTASGQLVVASGEAVGGSVFVNKDLAFSPREIPTMIKRLNRWRDLGFMTYTQGELATADHWVEAMLGTRQVAPDEVNPNNALLRDGCEALGYEWDHFKLNAQPGHFPTTDKMSPVERLLVPALTDADHPLYLHSGAHVARIEFDTVQGERRAVRLHVQQRAPLDHPAVLADPMRLQIPAGAQFTVEAARFILAAGALQTPALLMRSGAHHFNRQIGKGVGLHPGLPMLAIADHPIHAGDGVTASVYSTQFAADADGGFLLETMTAPPWAVSAVVTGSGAEVFDVMSGIEYLGGSGVILIDSVDPDNRVSIDHYGEPVVNYALTDGDKIRMRGAMVQLANVLFAGGAKRVAIPSVETGQAFYDSPEAVAAAVDRIAFTPFQTLLLSAHIHGSAKMGRDPAHSAVGPDHRLHGASNVFVGDASVFPESPAGNPMQLVYGMAYLLGERLLGGT